MGLLRFAGAAIVAALIMLWADPLASMLLFDLDLRARMGVIFGAFSWACMFGAVMLVTPERRHWASALMCALALAVALYPVNEIAAAVSLAFMELRPNWIPALVFHRVVALAAFALLLWPIWRWYDGLMRALASP